MRAARSDGGQEVTEGVRVKMVTRSRRMRGRAPNSMARALFCRSRTLATYTLEFENGRVLGGAASVLYVEIATVENWKLRNSLRGRRVKLDEMGK